ncbi:MAG: hypothetical protein MUF86_04925 [Akkermansiaceae bacterium]|jgi:rRNA-processing protein FCF1|nr:hypothetical protein [Akkermansiaceae bacterium]
MNPNFGSLISKYHEKGILIDTNLLLVLLVGNVQPRLIGKTARTDGYSIGDYELITSILGHFRRFITLPQILTETGNLLKRNCPNKNTLIDLSGEFARFVQLGQTKEVRKLSRRVTTHPTFKELGYADAAILSVAAGRYLLLTEDKPLQSFADHLGVDVLRFQWLRAI